MILAITVAAVALEVSPADLSLALGGRCCVGGGAASRCLWSYQRCKVKSLLGCALFDLRGRIVDLIESVGVHCGI